MSPIDVAYAALLEAGRRDLADEVIGFDDGDGEFYLEFDAAILSEDEWALMDRAEDLARQFVGLPPMNRVTAVAIHRQ